MLRVFLDISISEYIYETGLKAALFKDNTNRYHAQMLSNRIRFVLKQPRLLDGESKKVLRKLLGKDDNYITLDTLNMFTHGRTHTINLLSKEDLARFWNDLLPLFRKILDFESPARSL